MSDLIPQGSVWLFCCSWLSSALMIETWTMTAGVGQVFRQESFTPYLDQKMQIQNGLQEWIKVTLVSAEVSPDGQSVEITCEIPEPDILLADTLRPLNEDGSTN